MTDIPVIPDYDAQQIAGHWVLPAINQNANDQVLMHVSISVGPTDALKGSDVSVVVQTAQGALAKVEEPARAELLPVVTAKGSTAVAIYRFANPNNVDLTTVDVTLLGESAAFDVSTGIV